RLIVLRLKDPWRIAPFFFAERAIAFSRLSCDHELRPRTAIHASSYAKMSRPPIHRETINQHSQPIA
ncbi:hypothetical protein OAG56_03840, partial [Mariniblastus sp.]